MDIRQLRYFLTICEEGQISAAARKLHMAQPPLSQQLKALEDELGVSLLKRGNRSIQLSDAGELLKTRSQQIIQLCESTKKEVIDAKRNTKKTLTIGIVSSSHNVFLNHGVQAFHADYPNTDFILKEGNTFEVMDMLSKGIVEIGIVRTPFSNTLVNCVSLAQEAMVAVVHKEENPFSTTSITIDDLNNQPLLYYERYEALLSQLFVEAGFHPHVVCRNQDARTTLLWANAKMGIGIVPQSALSLIDTKNLSVLEIKEKRLMTQLMMITMKDKYVSDTALTFLLYYR
ncbi:MAG: LysR family transcriptional regulator [Longicatena sp.]